MKQGLTAVVLSLVVPTSMAANPASTAYVDTKFAGIQAQIDTLNANPSVAHPVGSCYGGGVVFYVNTTPNAPAGQRGLIAALSDAGNPTNYPWDAQGTVPVAAATATAYFTGSSNTQTLITYAQSITQAAWAAHDYDGGGETDWYLPAKDELMTMYTQWNSKPSLFAGCGGADPSALGAYWSSSQAAGGTRFAWDVDFGNGGVVTITTATQFFVRAVRAF